MLVSSEERSGEIERARGREREHERECECVKSRPSNRDIERTGKQSLRETNKSKRQMKIVLE